MRLNSYSRQALLSEAQRMGLTRYAGGGQDELQHGRYAATFFPGGNFIGQQHMRTCCSGASLTRPKFEEAVGNDILADQAAGLDRGQRQRQRDRIRAQFIKQNSKVKFDYAVLKQDDLRKGLHPADDELKAFYERHKTSYANSIPEKRKAKYAVIDTRRPKPACRLRQMICQAYYDQHRDQYRMPEQVKVSHILIKIHCRVRTAKWTRKAWPRPKVAPRIC